MNAEEKLEQCIKFPDYSTCAGSRLYGTSRESSDIDIRGFTFPPFEYLVGIKEFKCREMDEDTKIYSAKYFLQLALKGDPEATERFFVPEDKTNFIRPNGRRILALKDSIISMRICRRIMGYSYSEWRKAMGQKLIVSERTLTEDNVINDIRNKFKPDKLDMDHVIEILMSNKPRKIVPSLKDLGAKRRKEFDDYGYGVSCAAHSIRLVSELYELITTGKITFPLANADFLREMRNGKVKKEEAQKVYEEISLKVKNNEDNSVLPDKPDEKRVWKEYAEIVKDIMLKEWRN
tara:strand:- start:8337 stop:9209 length:873 start_codon:yes stop_codon:yes gene_type:complete